MNKTMSNTRMVRKLLLIIGFVLLLSFSLMIFTTPVHEACHVFLSTYFDDKIEVTEFHPFSPERTIATGTDHTLPSMLGFVVVREAYPGAFNDRPAWADFFQEIICLSVQLIITIVITLKATVLLVKKLR